MLSGDIRRRALRFLLEYGILIVILAVGLYVWVTIFQAAVVDYLDSDHWVSRHVWLGPGVNPGEFDFFGITLYYQFEGYSDYSFYYVHWGHNMLNGVLPYSGDFGQIVIDGVSNRNGAYMFPPLTVILYAIGIMIPVTEWGIGLLLAAFGYLTVFPVYGLGKELSGNRHVGEAAAFTYILAPNVLYHTTFLWMNPSPFIFFFFFGFYMLVIGKRHLGTLLIVTAALFKQTAWLLGIPLVVHLLMKAQPVKSKEEETPSKTTSTSSSANGTSSDIPKPRLLDSIIDIFREYFDLREFAVSVLLVLGYAGAIMYPFFVANPNLWNFLRLAMGGFQMESFTEVPGYSSPMRLQVLFVIAGLPALAEIVDFIVYSGGLLIMGVLIFWGLMMLENKYEGKRHVYLRRILFFTLLMMLWVNIAGPRGVFKYYFTMFAPFFSIFSSGTMCMSTEENVKFSTSMLWLPFLFSLMILIPVRAIYLVYVIAIFIGYLMAKRIGRVWYLATFPVRFVKRKISPRLYPLKARLSRPKKRILDYAYGDQDIGAVTEG
ncbi:MAG: hypothetical protein ACFFFC_01735 [Candidatus Thorarchaeota archaeon]